MVGLRKSAREAQAPSGWGAVGRVVGAPLMAAVLVMLQRFKSTWFTCTTAMPSRVPDSCLLLNQPPELPGGRRFSKFFHISQTPANSEKPDHLSTVTSHTAEHSPSIIAQGWSCNVEIFRRTPEQAVSQSVSINS